MDVRELSETPSTRPRRRLRRRWKREDVNGIQWSFVKKTLERRAAPWGSALGKMRVKQTICDRREKKKKTYDHWTDNMMPELTLELRRRPRPLPQLTLEPPAPEVPERREKKKRRSSRWRWMKSYLTMRRRRRWRSFPTRSMWGYQKPNLIMQYGAALQKRWRRVFTEERTD